MEKAAKALIATGKPARSLVLVADVGKADKCRQMAETLGCGWVAAPDALGNNGDINDLQQAEGLATVAELLATPGCSNAQATLSATDCRRAGKPAAALRWRIKGVLPESGLAAVYGPSGGGKSFALVLDMLASVADGCEWFEHRVNRAPVVYLALEGEAGLSQRVQAYRLQHGRHACKGMHFMTVPFSLLALGDVQNLPKVLPPLVLLVAWSVSTR
ncbi:MAG: AAA family ATPase [Chitinivorax sp.]